MWHAKWLCFLAKLQTIIIRGLQLLRNSWVTGGFDPILSSSPNMNELLQVWLLLNAGTLEVRVRPEFNCKVTRHFSLRPQLSREGKFCTSFLPC